MMVAGLEVGDIGGAGVITNQSYVLTSCVQSHNSKVLSILNHGGQFWRTSLRWRVHNDCLLTVNASADLISCACRTNVVA